MNTKNKLGDILAVQCLNIIMIARKVLNWIMVWFSTTFVLATCMSFVGSGEKVEDTSMAMNMLISAVVALCTAYLLGFLVSILFKYVILAEDSELYMLRSLDKVITTFSIIGGAITIYVPIVENQVSNAIHKLIFCACVYLFLSVVKRIVIHFLPEKLFVNEKNEYVSKHLKYSWMTFDTSGIPVVSTKASRISSDTFAKMVDKFEDTFHLSLDEATDKVESADNVDPGDSADGNVENVENDEIPVLHTGNNIDLPLPTRVKRTRIIPKTASPITRFRDKMDPINDPTVPLKYPIKMVGPVNPKLPLKYPLRIIGPNYMSYTLAPRVLNMYVASLDDDTSDDATSDDATLDDDTLDDDTSDGTSDDDTSG